MPRLTILLILLSGFSLISCNGPGYQTSLERTVWVVSEFGNRRDTLNRPITMTFEDGHVRGSAGCNSYGGEYRIAGDRISFEDIFATMMACPELEGIMEREQEFLQFLAGVETYRFSEDRLLLFHSDGEMIVFTPHDSME